MPSGGVVTRENLCRHTLILGETGSGKTKSGILPVLAGMTHSTNDTVSCALVIDPKKELKSYLDQQRDNITVHTIDIHNQDKRPILNLMAGEKSVVRLLKKNQYKDAAVKILLRAESLSIANPAGVLAGNPPGHLATRSGTYKALKWPVPFLPCFY